MTPPMEALRDAAELVWSALLGLELRTADGGAFAPDAGTVTGAVEIEGAWEGLVVVRCPWALGRRAAERMYGPDAGPLGLAEVSDAVGEIANMIGGALKGSLPRPSRLALPAVIVGPALPFGLSGARLLDEAELCCEPETLRVSLWQRGRVPAAAGDRPASPAWFI